MSQKVKLLSEQVINQIAAGEVIDRPASVVRELVDNAIDAGASAISVLIEEGGISLIKVSDDGEGMSREDALSAFQRHATSKLSEIDQLLCLTTLGFRGEALSSIAAVSRLAVRTRQRSTSAGVLVEISGGEIQGCKSCSCAVGTEFEVRDLFFNIPARRKFLKTPRTEESRIKNWMIEVAFAYPNVALRLLVGDRELLNIPAQSNFSMRAQQLIKGTTCTVSFGADIKVTGLIAHPDSADSRADGLVTLVNNRVVSDKTIQRAAKDAFGGVLKEREFPCGVISICIAGAEVDINVHPQKREVRFRDSGRIYQVVRQAISQALSSLSAPIALENKHQSEVKTYTSMQNSQALYLRAPQDSSRSQETSKSFPANVSTYRAQRFSFIESSATPVFNDLDRQALNSSEQNKFKLSQLRLLGQFFQCFILAEGQDKLYIVDMHAAHERYNFNLMRKQLLNKIANIQGLISPLTIELNTEQLEIFEAQKDELEGLGFEISKFGESSIVIRGVPAVLPNIDARAFIKEFLSADFNGRAFETRLDAIAARMACHASIRSGDNLNLQQAKALFETLDSTEFQAACPHGRPITVEINREEIERWFGR